MKLERSLLDIVYYSSRRMMFHIFVEASYRKENRIVSTLPLYIERNATGIKMRNVKWIGGND